MVNSKGVFITIEGSDGAGKSTQAKRLASYLQEKGYDIVLTREPGGTDISEKIRQILLDAANQQLDFKTEVLLYAASRNQLLQEVIVPALKQGKIVISDRFVDSSIAYQGYGRSLDLELVKRINGLIVEGFMPDLTILLDVATEVGLARNRVSHKVKDRMESEEKAFYTRVYQGFKALAVDDKRFVVIEGNQEQDQVFRQIVAAVEKKLLRE